MKIKISPYYCPHCHKYRGRWDVYFSNGRKPMSSGIYVEGWMPQCNACDTPVINTKIVIERELKKLFESENE